MVKQIITGLIILLIINVTSVWAVGFTSTDSFTSDGSSDTDAMTFENRDLDFTISSSDIMVACYDWYNGNCDENPTYNTCFAANQQDFDDCVEYDSWLNSWNYVQDSTPETQEMDTSTQSHACIDAKYYKNCDGSGGGNVYSVTQKTYSIFYSRMFDCDDGSPSWYQYDAEGYVAPYSYDYKADISCPPYKKCSESYDDSWVYTYNGVIPNPCKLDDGSTSNYACSQNSDCWSNYCSGDRYNYVGTCNSDGSNQFQVAQHNYDNTCGGSGYVYSTNWDYSPPHYCSTEVGNDYVCDADLDGGEYTGSWSPSVYCKKAEYGSCSASFDCWNDNGGYDCMGDTGNKMCTTGANGKNCYNNDDLQCDSGRCDTTCQARLSNGNSCDENSDCTSSICCNSLCSASCDPDIDVSPNPLVFNIG
ncbi:MAG: hypothetical protein KKB39_02295 [Nanoarchaeota archaeon]|nr:hypothetical protein [Nanoarchaeota archaeon]